MLAKERQKRTNYTVKNVETVAAGKDVRARLFTLAPGESFLGTRTARSRTTS